MAVCEDDKIAYIIETSQNILPDFVITQNSLERPVSSFVIKFYECFCNGVITEISEICEEDDIVPRNPTNDSDFIFVLYRYINHWLSELNPLKLSLTLADLYEPTAKRTIIRFWMLIHFLFYIKNFQDYKDVIIKHRESAAKVELKRREQEELLTKVSVLAEELARDTDLIDSLEKELELVRSQHSDLMKQEVDSQRELQKLKLDQNDRSSTYDTKSYHVANIKASIAQLNEQIVTDESHKYLLELTEYLKSKQEELKKQVKFENECLAYKMPMLEKFQVTLKTLSTHFSNCEAMKCLQSVINDKNLKLKCYLEEDKVKKSQLEEQLQENKKYKDSIKAHTEDIDIVTNKHDHFVKEYEITLKYVMNEKTREEQLEAAMRNKKVAFEEEILKVKNEYKVLFTKVKEMRLFYEKTYQRMVEHENLVTNTLNSALSNLEDDLQSNHD